MLRFLHMASEQIVGLLIQERDKLNRAIEALQGSEKRTTAAPTPIPQPIGAAPKKRHVSAAARRRMALGQKKRWAAIKATK
jgi:hypothetical protein